MLNHQHSHNLFGPSLTFISCPTENTFCTISGQPLTPSFFKQLSCSWAGLAKSQVIYPDHFWPSARHGCSSLQEIMSAASVLVADLSELVPSSSRFSCLPNVLGPTQKDKEPFSLGLKLLETMISYLEYLLQRFSRSSLTACTYSTPRRDQRPSFDFKRLEGCSKSCHGSFFNPCCHHEPGSSFLMTFKSLSAGWRWQMQTQSI